VNPVSYPVQFSKNEVVKTLRSARIILAQALFDVKVKSAVIGGKIII